MFLGMLDRSLVDFKDRKSGRVLAKLISHSKIVEKLRTCVYRHASVYCTIIFNFYCIGSSWETAGASLQGWVTT